MAKKKEFSVDEKDIGEKLFTDIGISYYRIK
jgi:hypothetical protein